MVNNNIININVANFCLSTTALGPGNRAVVWVQGCPRHCKGCIAPEWIPIINNQLIPAADLANIILSNPNLEGLTLSGGEPMLQPRNLRILVESIKSLREINVICFTGYTLDELRNRPNFSEIQPFLDVCDVLIDGPYVEKLNNGRGLRGSTNQNIHYLSTKLNNFDFENCYRKVDINIQPGGISFIGIPPSNGYRELMNIPSNMGA